MNTNGAKKAEKVTGAIEVVACRNGRDHRSFLDLPYKLYSRDPYWVPPLRMAQEDILNTSRHPFYKTSQVEMFVARSSGRVVGRIMAIDNHAHNEFHGERAGFFGFFEVEPNYEAAKALFDAARDWLRLRGAEVIRGRVNPSTNYEVGMLVEGFQSSPTVMMTYNPPYYPEYLERYGFKKAMDLYAYSISHDSFNHSEKLRRVAARLKKKDRIRVRAVNLKEFSREVEIIRRIYNDAWGDNWGFVPVSEQEFEHLAKDMKQIVDPNIVLIAEQEVEESVEPRPIGFFLAVPDINLALKKINGRLLPFGLVRLLWESRKIQSIRIITMGVVKEHQNLGVASVFYDEIYRLSPIHGYPRGEMSWVLETNLLMNRAAELIGGRRSKTYRVYEMPAT